MPVHTPVLRSLSLPAPQSPSFPPTITPFRSNMLTTPTSMPPPTLPAAASSAESAPEGHHQRQSASVLSSRATLDERFDTIIKILRERRLSPVDFLVEILDPFSKYHDIRTKLYSRTPQKVEKLLELISKDSQGLAVMSKWLRPLALKIVQETVDEEMETVKKELWVPGGIQDIPLTFYETLSQTSLLEGCGVAAPLLFSILCNAAQTQWAHDRNKIKEPSLVSHNLQSL